MEKMQGSEETKKNNAPPVSVVMPAYNARPYIEAAICSLKEQTYSSWELVVVDDCSDDGTSELLRELAREDDRIHPIFNENNRGAAAGRNAALERCTGKYIAFLDADDIWRPEKLARQTEIIEQTGADIVYCSYAMIDENGTPCYPDFVVDETADFDSMLYKSVFSCSTVLLRRSALADHRFRTDFYHEDYALWMELLQSGCTAVGITDVLADYRIVKKSRSNDKIKSAWHRWRIYRNCLHMPLFKSINAFAHYAVSGLKKYNALRKEI